ncbi:MAG: type II secretion system minor pseudopilin GspJ [Gammaproteobacteria bacterium]
MSLSPLSGFWLVLHAQLGRYSANLRAGYALRTSVQPERPALTQKSGSWCNIRASKGFTLLELLVATAIVAILGMTAYSGLDIVMSTQQRTEQQGERLRDLQMAIRFIERDVQQLANRPIRDEFGDTQPPLQSGQQPLLSLTHAGWRNPAGQFLRSRFQRVAYDTNEDDQLVRTSWITLDGGRTEEAIVVTLLNDVDLLEFRYNDGDWQESWPPISGASEETTTTPNLVEVTLEAKPWGRITRLIAVPK